MKIGVFDSGYGGLTILRDIRAALPEYDYIYLGDNARAPYGSRSFDIVYQYTLQAVRQLFAEGCKLVILGCNTASAKALRSIQQNDLPKLAPDHRVLGIIIPTVEALADLPPDAHVGIMATQGTVDSHSYRLETIKLFAEMTVTEKACPMWVPLVENDEASSPGADYFVEKYCNMLLQQDPDITTVILACTHYPLLYDKIRNTLPPHINIILQGKIVADSLRHYLHRHPEIENSITRTATVEFLTSEDPEKFNRIAAKFIDCDVKARRISL